MMYEDGAKSEAEARRAWAVQQAIKSGTAGTGDGIITTAKKIETYLKGEDTAK